MASNQISMEKKFELICAEATNFYNLLITISTTFLGGLTFFLEKVAPQPKAETIIWLGIGYGGFILCIIAVALIRILNITSGELALQGSQVAK